MKPSKKPSQKQTTLGFIFASETQLEMAREISVAGKSAETTLIIDLRNPAPATGKRDLRPFGKPTIVQPYAQASFLRKMVEKAAYSKFLPEKIKRKLKTALEQSQAPLDSLANFPAHVFAGNDRSPSERKWIRKAKTGGSRVYLLQESIRRDEAMQQDDGFSANGAGGCDRIYAWGRTSVDYYLKIGRTPDTIIPTGNPRVDSYVKSISTLPEIRNLKHKLGIPKNSITLLLASNPVYGMMLKRPFPQEEFIRKTMMLFDWARSQGVAILVKPHYVDVEHFEKWGLRTKIEESEGLFYNESVKLEEGIKACEGSLIYNSSVALEAALCGRRCGMLFPDSYGHGTDFLENGLCSSINSETDFQRFVRELDEPIPELATQRYLESTEGSANRILADAFASN